MTDEWRRGPYEISTDRTRLDFDVIHGFLSRCYWAENIPRDLVARSIEHSLPFGLYHEGDGLVGFSRVITDFATFGYVADVFVLDAHRARGLARWMMETVLAHPQLQDFRRWVLLTRDAHPVYKSVGFTALPEPDLYMELRKFPGYVL